ncbi:MAG: MGH1-like glycoside hydrolase domain-containing protein [Massilia sp.]
MMKKTSFLLFAALLCGSAGAVDQSLFIRGGFNGWGTDNALVRTGEGIYEARILLSPGNHPFKVGNGDWSAEWVINPSANVAVVPGNAYPMDPHPGPEDYLFVKQTASYVFTLDTRDSKTPVLRVQRIDAPPVPSVDPHQGRAGTTTLQFATFDGKRESAHFSSPDPTAALRHYVQSTTMQLRDPGPQFVTYQESATLPTVRSGNLAFDALFALAGAEMQQDAVAHIRDGNYNGGAPIACDCFETGEKWHYVWTRDLSYAADLGLAMLDPQRVRNSLDFKLSPWREGVPRASEVAGSADGLQIIQDTGSGGSWPVSTDRVSWAFGAEQVLRSLSPQERAAFAPRALKALINTVENDRLAAFDTTSGLYSGEQSFLDWRDQSYASWIVNDLASMATAKALSTNVAHYKALSLTASLAREQGKTALAVRYADWARKLKVAINTRLWLPDAGMYSSLSAAHFDGAPLHKFDWLGQSLAIITGVASAEQARQILAHYPHGPMGAPVIFPQQRGMPVYHNRAIWPFVTAYGLRAAAMSGNTSVADAAYATLTRAAALNLSNMENLEWLSGQPLLLDENNPSLIGPVINSRRQLWSVGAYLGMVIRQVFGVSTTNDGIALHPFVTAKLRRETFDGNDLVTLNGLLLQGRQVSVRLHLPKPEQGDGYYSVASVMLDAKRSASAIAWDMIKDGSVIDIQLGALRKGQQQITTVSADPYNEAANVFAPHDAVIVGAVRDAAGNTRISAARPTDASRINIYKDGDQIASDAWAENWIDHGAPGCYAIEAMDDASGNRSHHSAPVCTTAAVTIAVTDSRVASNVAPSGPGERFAEPRLKDWGKPGDTFVVSAVNIADAGSYAIQLRYHNSANQINLGISGGVKWLAVRDSAGRLVAQGVVQLPHARVEKADTPLVYSTPLTAHLPAGTYTLSLTDFYNMSYLQANSSFSAAGGTTGPSNMIDLYGVRLMRLK